MFRIALLLLFLSSPAKALDFFGYVGVMCDFDDPLDDTTLTDYSAEVAGFTNINHVCLPADPADWADRIKQANVQFRPLLSVEGAFDFARAGPDGPESRTIWPMVRDAVIASAVDPARITFYLVDEPTLRGIDPVAVDRAAAIIRADFPTADVLLVEACSMDGPPPIAPHLTLWGFDCYTFADPGQSPQFIAYLDLVKRRLGPDQRLVLVMDANHTEYHAAAGIALTDMGNVARAYAALALSRPEVAGMLGYTWAGGIDSLTELGVRDMPQAVIDAHREVGKMLLGLK